MPIYECQRTQCGESMHCALLAVNTLKKIIKGWSAYSDQLDGRVCGRR